MGSASSKYITLCSPPECLSNNSLFWHTGNFAGRKIVESGISKPKLQPKAIKKRRSFSCLQMKNLNLKIPRISLRDQWAENNSGIATCFKIKSQKCFTDKTLSSIKKCRSSTWGVPAANTLPCAHLQNV